MVNVPTLRFPSFTEEWQKHSLDKLGTTIIGLTYSPSDVVKENGTIVFRSSNIQNGEIDYSDIVRVGKEIKPVLRTKESDILICARNGSSRLIGKNAILKKSDEGQTFGAFMMIYRSKYNKFIRQLLNTKRYSMQVAQNIGARINQITTSDLNNFIFNFPTNPHEQKKIADFLSLLDERIALQSKLIEDLKILKSAIVERLYGQYSSRIRIGTIIKPVSIRNRDGGELEVMSVSNKYGFIAQLEQFEERLVASEDTSNYKVITPGIFAYNPARINVGSIAQYKGDRPCIVSPMYICFECGEQVIGGYLEHFFSTKYFHKEMEKRLEGSVRLCLSFEALCNIPISLPTIEQQQKYAHVVGIISEQISTETGILQAYQKQKLYLLSAMFI